MATTDLVELYKDAKAKIARIIFEHMSDIDGDEADWLYFREDCEAAAAAILKEIGTLGNGR